MDIYTKLKLQGKHDDANNHIYNTMRKHNASDVSGGSFFVKNDYLNYVRKFIDENKDKEIVKLQAFKQPVGKNIEMAFNLLSLGKFNPKIYGYDMFFHLGLLATLNTNERVKIEKNAVINIEKITKPIKNAQYMDIQLDRNIMLFHHGVERQDAQINFKVFLDNTENNTVDYFKYNSFNNNCQIFVLNLLKCNNIKIDDKLHDFIYQKVEDMNDKTVGHIANMITDIHAFKERITRGGSLKNNYLTVY